jgi:hypothetical protein
MTLKIEGIFGVGYCDMWLHFIVFDFAKTKVYFEWIDLCKIDTEKHEKNVNWLMFGFIYVKVGWNVEQ